MTDAQLSKMTAKDLRLLREKVLHLIERKQAEARIALKQTMADLAAQAGYSLGEVIGAAPTRKIKAAARWRDPQTGVLWSGRGRVPNNFDRTRAVQT